MRLNIRIAAGVAGAAAILAAPSPARGQGADTVGVVVAALEHATHSLPAGRAMVDPRLVCSARLVGWSCPPEVHERTAELGLELGSREFSYLCMTSSDACRLVGPDVLLELSAPRIFRRTASVVLDVWWRTDDPERPVGQRRSHLHLERDDEGGWSVVDEDVRLPADATGA
jgi:hypothetical protein